MKHFYPFLIVLLISSLGFGQTVIDQQGFETNLDGYSHSPSQTPSADPGDQYFHRAEPGDSNIYEGTSGPYTNVTGSWLFVGSNPNTINSGNPGILNLDPINVTGFSDLELSADFGGVPNDWDASDELRVEFSWDNSNWNLLYNFQSPVTNDPLELGNNATGGSNTANGTVLTFALQTITSNNFSGSGTTLYLRIICDSDANYEAFGVDNIVLRGTSVSSNDTDSEVLAPSSGQVTSSTITAANTTSALDAVAVFKFNIEDKGTSDGLPTNVTRLRFVPGTNNTADWADHIQGITLTDVTDTMNLIDLTPNTTVTINDLEIIIDYGPPLVILDNSFMELELGIYLNNIAIVDNSIIQMEIPALGSGFQADLSGSGFIEPQPGTITGPQMPIDVIGTDLILDQQPTPTQINVIMTPAVTVNAVDTNGNIDFDYANAIDLTPTGLTFAGSATTSVLPVSGVATFDNLIFDAIGTGDLFASATGLNDSPVSNMFSISAFIAGCNSIFSDIFSTDLSQWLNVADWTISSGELKHDLSGIESESYIYADIGTQDLTSGDYEWDFCMRNGSWEPSTANRFAFFLISDETDLLASPSGYAVGLNFGSVTTDLLVLYSVNNGSFTEIITSAFAWSNSDDVCIRVTRSASGDWELFYNENGNGELSAGTVANTDFTSGNYLGSIFDFTTSRAGQLWIDDVNVCKNDGTINFSYDGSVWTPGDPNGASTASDNINILMGDAILSSNTTCNQFSVFPGASLTINSGVTLTANTLDLDSTSDEFASLILDGTLAGGTAGNVTYRRYTNGAGSGTTGGNDLITSPVTGMFFVDLVQDPENEFSLFGHPDNGTTSILEYLFGPFDNSIGSYMTYFINDEINGPDLIGNGDDAFENIEPVKGYRAGTNGGTTLAFRGGVNSGSVSSFDFDDYGLDAPNIEIWNLTGNPYPSYLNSQTFLSVNGGVIDETVLDPNFNAIYAYNDGTDGSGIWTIINSVQNSTRNIAPGQGFFVASNGTGQLSFTPAMRTTVGTDDFIIGRNSNPTFHLGLNLSNSQTNYETDFYFTVNASTSLDPGYDAGVYSSNVSGLSLYSHLVENNQGIPMAIQALGETDYNDIVIPLGVNANQGEQIAFSITENDLPDTVNVYLEDNITNTFTPLNTVDYVITPNTNLTGTGRFYVHFSNTVLSAPDNSFDGLTIYADQSNRTINISGEVGENTVARIYDIQGRLITSKILTSSLRLQSIDVNAINSGVYICELSNGTQNKTQKVILK